CASPSFITTVVAQYYYAMDYW
nr:immunoglobulin heavy chain junction region [Mus musculus]